MCMCLQGSSCTGYVKECFVGFDIIMYVCIEHLCVYVDRYGELACY